MTEVATNFTSLIGIVEDILGLFTQFPINILVTGMVAGVAFGILRKTRKVAG